MSTQTALPFTQDKIQRHREGKRAQIERYFSEHLGEKVSSRSAHWRWGSSFRSRVSDINLDPHSEITISNEVCWARNAEQSWYWGVRK